MSKLVKKVPMENKSSISLGVTIIYSLSLRKALPLGRDTCECEIQRNIVLEHIKTTWAPKMGNFWGNGQEEDKLVVICSTVRKRHKQNTEQTNGDYLITQPPL